MQPEKTILKRYAFSFLLCLLNSTVVLAQQYTLEKQTGNHKQIRLDPDDAFTIVTKNGSWNSSILALTDSTITAGRFYYSGHDTVYKVTKKISRKYPDGIKMKKGKVYTRDTAVIRIDEILYVKRPLLKKHSWLMAPAMFAIGVPLAIALLPVAAITKGAAGVREWLLFEAMLIGISGPPVFLLTRERKFELGHKWKLNAIPVSPSPPPAVQAPAQSPLQ